MRFELIQVFFGLPISKLPTYILKLYYEEKKRVKYVKDSKVNHHAAVPNMQVYIHVYV